MKFINKQGKAVFDLFPSTVRADASIFEDEDFTRCNYCGAVFHGHMHEIRAINHLANQHMGQRN